MAWVKMQQFPDSICITGNLPENEVGEEVVREAGGGEGEAVVAERHAEPLPAHHNHPQDQDPATRNIHRDDYLFNINIIDSVGLTSQLTWKI